MPVISTTFLVGTKNQPKRLYALDRMHIVDNINAYLIEAPDIFIGNRKKTISSVSNVVFGSMPNDGGILSDYSFENKEAAANEVSMGTLYFFQTPLAFFLQECYYDYTKKAPTPKWMLQVYSDIVLTDTAYPVGQTG